MGRIHDDKEAINAVWAAKKAGFININLDLMHGLPNQTVEEALQDLETALSLHPTHLSWYQLTLEPNTPFAHHPPSLPPESILWDIQQQGQEYLAKHGFHPYEISAYIRHEGIDYRARHNLNYWKFGDYLGIGAGAHGKITDETNNSITRYWKAKHPNDYLNPMTPFIAGQKKLCHQEIPLEFMMNTLRLYQLIPFTLFETHTGLSVETIVPTLIKAKELGLLNWDAHAIEVTHLGKRYLNNLLELF